MSKGLSKREKIMISILAVFVIITGFVYFAIMPAYGRYTASVERLKGLELENTITEDKLNREEAARQGYMNSAALLDEIIKTYPAVMPNEGIDRLLTGMCLRNGLNALSLSLSDNAADTAAQPFSITTANMNLSGSYSQFKSLIREAESIKYLRIVKAAYTESGVTQRQGSSNINISFEVFMYNDILQ